MEDTNYGATVTPVVPESYNANLLVTYKVIRGYSDAEYTTDKVSSIEWDLHNGREYNKRVTEFNNKIDTVIVPKKATNKHFFMKMTADLLSIFEITNTNWLEPKSPIVVKIVATKIEFPNLSCWFKLNTENTCFQTKREESVITASVKSPDNSRGLILSKIFIS